MADSGADGGETQVEGSEGEKQIDESETGASAKSSEESKGGAEQSEGGEGANQAEGSEVIDGDAANPSEFGGNQENAAEPKANDDGDLPPEGLFSSRLRHARARFIINQKTPDFGASLYFI